MNAYARFLPGCVVAIALLFLSMKMVPAPEKDGAMRLDDFGKLPVVDGGRVKPIDTVARTTLMTMSGRQECEIGEDEKVPAIQWLLDVMTGAKEVMRYKAFHIDDEGLLGLLGLRPRSGFRYAPEEFASHMEALRQQVEIAEAKDEKQLDPFQRNVLILSGQLKRYMELARGAAPLVIPPLAKADDWQSYAAAESEAVRDKREIIRRLREMGAHANPELAKLNDEQLEARLGPELDRYVNPATRMYTALLDAYARGDAKAFNKELTDYEKLLDKDFPRQTSLTAFEAFFNHFAPFYQCAVLYGFVFVLTCVSWLCLPKPLNRAAFWLAVLTFAVHFSGLVARMYMQGRWFVMVTNLYSSAVFIGFVSVLACLVMEAIFRNGVALAIGSVVGVVSLIIAHNLAEGDTMEMMRAVLDTNFWLATHVTCITIGYSATLVAGSLGIMFITRGVFTRTLKDDMFRTLSQMIYGVVCFATLFSFVGTVLGGIWADQSWGRFWGWDSKENGALLIVIMNSLILHARWAGLVKQRGVAVLAVVGNIVTAWSWFGTNQLGVGLHAYGFNDKLSDWLDRFWVTQLALIAVGLVPLRYWLSFKKRLQA